MRDAPAKRAIARTLGQILVNEKSICSEGRGVRPEDFFVEMQLPIGDKEFRAWMQELGGDGGGGDDVADGRG